MAVPFEETAMRVVEVAVPVVEMAVPYEETPMRVVETAVPVWGLAFYVGGQDFKILRVEGIGWK